MEGAVSEQLRSLVEKLRIVESTTSDSGAVSDYSENTDCKSHSITSLDCFTEDNDSSCHHDSKATLGVNNVKDTASSECHNNDKAADLNIEVKGKLSQRDEEEQLPAKEDTLSGLESKQPSAVTDCNKSTDEQPQSIDSSGENAGEQLDKVAMEITENKRETIPDDQFRIRRKTKKHYGRGYSNWRRGYGYYDNRRGRSSYHDNSRNRGQQRMTTSSPRDHKVENNLSFNHEEVAAFLWNSKAEILNVMTLWKLIIFLNFRVESSRKSFSS